MDGFQNLHRVDRFVSANTEVQDEPYVPIMYITAMKFRLTDGARAKCSMAPAFGLSASLSQSGRGFPDLFSQITYSLDKIWTISDG